VAPAHTLVGAAIFGLRHGKQCIAEVMPPQILRPPKVENQFRFAGSHSSSLPLGTYTGA